MRHTAQELEVPDLGHESTILPVPVRPVGSWTEASFQSVDSDWGVGVYPGGYVKRGPKS